MTLFDHTAVWSNEEKADILLRKVFLCFLVLSFIATAIGAYSGYMEHNVWKMGDWLINYQGGLIRRGLLGEVIFQLSLLTHINPGYYAFLFQTGFYAIFFIFSYLLLTRQQNVLPYTLLVFSPFIFTFQLNDLQGGYRKEIIYFALLAFTAYSAKVHEHRKFEKIFYTTLLCYPLIILTHEMLALFLPYLLIIYISVTEMTKRNIITISLLLLPSAAAFFASIFSHVNSNQTIEIFNAITREGHALSGGAIAWLDKPTSAGIEQVTQLIHSEHYIIYYLLIILLSALAFLPLQRQLSTIFNNQLSRVLVLISAIGTIALLAVAFDWGRFIYIHLVSLFLLSLLFNTHHDQRTLYGQRTGQTIFQGKTVTLLFSLFFIIYTLCWHIPHCCSPAPYAHNYHQINAVAYIQPYINLIGSVLE